MSPPKRLRPDADNAEPETTTNHNRASYSTHALMRRRRAAERCEPDDNGWRDPWRPWRPERLTDSYVDGYRDAALHLLAQGLLPAPNVPAMRVLWGRRGADQRLARTLAEHWQVVA